MNNEAARSRWSALALTALGHFVNDGSGLLVPIVADIVATEKSAPVLAVTLMSVAFYTSSSLFSVIVGRLADRSGSPAKMIGVGLALLSTGILGYYVSETYSIGVLLAILVILSSVLAGFGSAFYHPLAATVLQGIFLSRRKGKVLGINGAAGGLGATIYPLIFFFAVISLTRAGAFVLLVLIGYASSSAIVLGLRERRVVQGIEERQQKGSAKEAATRGIVILTLVTAVRSISTTGVSFWLPTYITTQKGAGIGTILGITLSAMYASAILGQLLFGALMDRLDKRLVLGIGSGGSAVCTVGYILTGGITEFTFIILFGFFTFSNFPTLLALASEYVPESSLSLANALVWGIGGTGGSIIGPALVGLIIGSNFLQLNVAFELMAVIGLIGALATPLMPRTGRPKSLVTMT